MIHSFCVSDLKSKHVNVYNKYRNKYFFDEIKKKLQQISKTYLKNIIIQILTVPYYTI